jgi:nicotinamide riboside transporter PnuC
MHMAETQNLQRYKLKKFFFRSKVNWAGIVIAIIGILQALVALFSTHGDWKSWTLACATFVLGAAVIILRTFWITDKP